MTDIDYENGYILIDNGKIIGIGQVKKEVEYMLLQNVMKYDAQG
jgi:hypothetical protein